MATCAVPSLCKGATLLSLLLPMAVVPSQHEKRGASPRCWTQQPHRCVHRVLMIVVVERGGSYPHGNNATYRSDPTNRIQLRSEPRINVFIFAHFSFGDIPDLPPV